MLDEGVGSAEGDRMDDELAVFDEGAGGFEAPGDVHRDHRTSAVHLPTDEPAGIASGQTGVTHRRDLRSGPQPASEIARWAGGRGAGRRGGACAARSRTGRGRRPRWSRWGPGGCCSAPVTARTRRRRVAHSLFVAMTPPLVSPWPPMYFAALWRTSAAP